MAPELQLRAPGHADVGRQHGPGPVDALVEFVGQVAYLGFLGVVLVEVAAGEQHAGHEQCRVDGR